MIINNEIYELLSRYFTLQVELEDAWEENSGSNMSWGCDCGCGGDSALEYTSDLEEEICDIEGELSKLGITFNLEGDLK